MNGSAFDRRRARLLDYAPWIFRDYMTNQGPATLIVMLLIGTSMLMPLLRGAADSEFGNIAPNAASAMLQAILPPLAFLGPFFATNGIIANDRKFSFYRFLFAKPLSPVGYYAVTFLIYGIGFLLIVVAVMGIYALAVRPTFPAHVLTVSAIMYIALGGIGFLLSAAWRYDWLSLVSVLFVSAVLWEQFGESQNILARLLYLLPPMHRTGPVYAVALNGDVRGAATEILWLVGYGLAAFVAGMIVVRKRPLGTS